MLLKPDEGVRDLTGICVQRFHASYRVVGDTPHSMPIKPLGALYGRSQSVLVVQEQCVGIRCGYVASEVFGMGIALE